MDIENENVSRGNKLNTLKISESEFDKMKTTINKQFIQIPEGKNKFNLDIFIEAHAYTIFDL